VRLFQHRTEHRREIAGRGIDDLQYLGGRGLLLQRLAEVAVAGVELVEQPGALDGDRGLVREGLEQLDLGAGEGLHIASSAADHAERLTFSEHRHSEERPVIDHRLQYVARPGVVVGVGQDILGMHRLRVDKGAAHDERPHGCSREEAVKCRRLLRRHAVDRDQVELPVFEARHGAELRFADPGRARDDGLKYRGKLAGRAVDDLQHRGGGGLLRQRFIALGGALCELALEHGHGLAKIAQRVIEHCHPVSPPIVVRAARAHREQCA
jgi:hypothetical protein